MNEQSLAGHNPNGFADSGHMRLLAELNAPKDTLPPIVDAAEFLAERIESPGELVCELVHKGSKLVLGGDSKTYKTWTLTDLAVAVASGTPWFSFKTTQGRVLYLNFEIQSPFFQRRLKAVASAKGVTIAKGQIEVWNLRGYAASYQTLLPAIIERVRESDYSLIVLDPIYKLYGNTDENSAGAVALLLNALESLAVQTGAAVAFGAHYSKGNQAGKQAVDRISGSGVFARDPDSILNFTRHEQHDAFTVEATLRNFKPVAPFVVRWQYPLMRRDNTLDPSKLRKVKGGRANEYNVASILSCLSKRKLATSAWQKLCAKVKPKAIPRATFYRLLKEAQSLGLVRQNARDEWQVSKVSKPTSDTSDTTRSHNPLGYETGETETE